MKLLPTSSVDHVPRTEPGFWGETFRDVDWTQQKANDFRFTLEFKDLTWDRIHFNSGLESHVCGCVVHTYVVDSLSWAPSGSMSPESRTTFLRLSFLRLPAGGGGSHASSSGPSQSQEAPAFCRRGWRRGEKLRVAAEPRRLAVGQRTEQLRQAGGGGGGAAEAVSALPHHDVTAEQAGRRSGWQLSSEGQWHHRDTQPMGERQGSVWLVVGSRGEGPNAVKFTKVRLKEQELDLMCERTAVWLCVNKITQQSL